MGIEKETLERLKAEHDEVHELEAMGVSIAVRLPSGPAFDRFMSTSASKRENAHKALGALVIDCLVHPSPDEWRAILAKRPGLAVTFGTECAKLAGLVDEVERKKA